LRINGGGTYGIDPGLGAGSPCYRPCDAHLKANTGEPPGYRSACQQLRLQQKKLLQERDQLRARIRELEAQLVQALAKNRDREAGIVREIVRKKTGTVQVMP
jgi:flagellar motility protein MotE (MotC chaperone)